MKAPCRLGGDLSSMVSLPEALACEVGSGTLGELMFL